MDTTQSESGDTAAPAEQPASSSDSRWWLAGVGVLLSPLTFLFGGFVALLALPFVLPPLKRWRMFAYGLFVSVVLVRALMALGVNPVLTYAQSQVIAKLEAALGAEVAYESFDGDAVNGQLRFSNLSAEIPELEGSVALEEVVVDVGLFLLFRSDRVSGSGNGLRVKLNADEGRLEKWLEEREPAGGESVKFEIEDGVVEVAGGVGARITLANANGQSSEQGWVLNLGLKQAAVTFRERTHTFEIYGGISVGDTGEGLRVDADLSAIEPELGRGVMRGSLGAGTDTVIRCDIDMLFLGPLWARYRKVDEYGGRCRGNIKISGELNLLVLELDVGVENYSYYHTTAMGLDRNHAFELPEGRITGRVVLVDGRDVLFQDVTLVTDDATLATGNRMNARGRGMVVLNGVAPKFTGRLEAVVESGEINQGITWSKEQTEGLEDITPNIVIVGEQFANLDMKWEVDVEQITVNAAPLTGTMSGRLSGTFKKEEGARVGKLRAEGELSMEDGKVDCLGLQGDFTGKLTFNPTAPTRHATLRGQIDGALGETRIDCEVTGEISKPGFIFKGMSMSPEALGRKIFRYSTDALTEAEELERRNECARIFGAYAASQRNPFEARNSGKVFFGFR